MEKIGQVILISAKEGRNTREICNQLVVDRQIGGQHKEIIDPMRQVQVRNERPHQARFADPGRQRKA